MPLFHAISPFIEIVIIMILINYLLYFFWNTKSMDLILGVVAFLLLFTISSSLSFSVLHKLMLLVVNIAAIAIVVIFQPEFRVALSKLSLKSKRYREITEFDKFLEQLSSSVYRMAERQIGALIVLEKDDSLDEYVKKAIVINADFCSELLETIFARNAALHDGAVIIRDKKVLCASAILPLADTLASQKLGTRHKAAIGLTLVSDACVIVISEESGKVSIATDGIITRGIKMDRFIGILRSLFTKEDEEDYKKETLWDIVTKSILVLKKIFIDNWIRKLISLILAIIIWFAVDQSLTTTKSLQNINVKVVNLPDGKTIKGLQTSGILNKKISLSLTGRRSFLASITPNDLEVLIDASKISPEGIVDIQMKHLHSANPDLKLAGQISGIGAKNIVLKLVASSSAKIPIYISPPIGEAPKGFQFLDIWPYHLNLTVNGPEEVIKKLKSRGLKLTFNLNDIPKADLERSALPRQKSVISYYVPDDWKSINVSEFSDQPLKIDDPDAKLLRIDFIRADTIPINFAIPINLFFPPDYKLNLPPASLHIANTDLVTNMRGIKILNKQLYTKGVSELFVKVIRDMVTISINLTPNANEDNIDWSIQFVNPTELENRYVSMMITEIQDEELKDMSPIQREEHIRNRFRNYMNRFALYTQENELLKLNIQLKAKEIFIKDANGPLAEPSLTPLSNAS